MYNMEKIDSNKLLKIIPFVSGGFSLVILFIISRYNYLVFHTLAEFVAIAVAWGLFIIMWNTKEMVKNDAFVFLGIAFLFIGGLDLFHTLSYKGMGVFGAENSANIATQLWITARYMESISLCLFILWFGKRIKHLSVIGVYSIVTGIAFSSIFFWGNFPDCYIDGSGLTLFKKSSEYIICILLMFTQFFLLKRKSLFDQKVYKFLSVAIVLTIISELAFTFYISVYGLSNLIGHFFKIISFYLIYKAMIHTGLKKPFKLIFKELNSANKSLTREIDERIKEKKEREQLIVKLKDALYEVKQLSGLLPICSHCKKIRDDKGYWKQIDVYIQKHSQATFSHGMCPECSDELYGKEDWYIDMKNENQQKK